MKFIKREGGKTQNMVIYFTLSFWCCYVAQMHGRPKPESDSCQKLLYFLLMNPQLVVKGWRNRQQLFSSASVFEIVAGELKTWIYDGDHSLDESDAKAVQEYEKQVVKRKRMLRKMIYNKEMYDVVGAAMIGFINQKAGAFPKATLSQRHFQLVPVWKRANIAIRLFSHVLDFHTNHHWYKFKYESYKFITSVFKAYCAADEQIWGVCKEYVKMPKDVSSGKTTPPRKKRTRNMFEVVTPPKNQPEEVICVITDSESDDEASPEPAPAAATPPKKPRTNA